MRKTILSIITFALLISTLPLSAIGQTDRLEIHFFGSRTCGECLEIKETILKPLALEFPESISLQLDRKADHGTCPLRVGMAKF